MTPADTVVRRLLDNLETRIDLDHVARARARRRAGLSGEALTAPPLTCYLPYEGDRFRPYPYPEAFGDPAKMMVNELLVGFTSIFHAVDLRDDAPYCLRPNLGTGIVASMFGARVSLLENNMPWVEPLGLPALRRLVDEPLPDPRAGLGQRVLDQYDYFEEVLANYPRCRAAFEITLPDLQGPFDTAELLWGSEIFVGLNMERGLVIELLARITEQMVRAYALFSPRTRDSLNPDAHHQHAVAVQGKLLARADSVILMSPRMYRDVVAPFDAELAARLGGIGIHFCGNGEHHIDNLLSVPGVQSLDFGQPHLMDLDAVYAKAAARRVACLRLTMPELELTAAQVRRRFPVRANLVFQAKTVREAHQVCARYRAER